MDVCRDSRVRADPEGSVELSNPATLAQAQRLFAQILGQFLVELYRQNYEVSVGEAWRSDTEAQLQAQKGAGITNSLHRIRLAIDLNVFADNVWLQTVADLEPVGAIWKSMHPLCCWGGDFSTRPDADHYSLTWQGIK